MKKLLEKYRSGGLCFFMFYLIYYTTTAPITSFLSVYYIDCGLLPSQIGILQAIGPLVTIFGQLFWGNVADKARYKNYVLITLTAVAAVCVYGYSLGVTYKYFFVVTVIYTFFQCSIQNIGDALALSHAEKTGISYAKMRLGGSLGYSFMSLITGLIIAGRTDLIFPISIIALILLVLIIAALPKIKGGRNGKKGLSGGKKVSYLSIFKNKSLTAILFFNFLVYVPYFFYYTFYPVQLRALGGTNQMIGIANFLSAFCELPFLLLADKLVQKFGFKPILLFSGSTMALRLFLAGIVQSAWPLVFVNIIHGTGHIVVSYCTARYINTVVSDELKASGQTLLGLVTYGVAKIVASYIGGYATEWLGMNRVFIICGVLSIFSVLVLQLMLHKNETAPSA